MNYRHIGRPRRQPHAYILCSVTLLATISLAFHLVPANIIWLVVGGSAGTLLVLILEEALFLRR